MSVLYSNTRENSRPLGDKYLDAEKIMNDALSNTDHLSTVTELTVKGKTVFESIIIHPYKYIPIVDGDTVVCPVNYAGIIVSGTAIGTVYIQMPLSPVIGQQFTIVMTDWINDCHILYDLNGTPTDVSFVGILGSSYPFIWTEDGWLFW